MDIIALGETTYDIIFKNGKPVDGSVGGSVLNTSVSLGRLGLPVSLVALCGSDQIGATTTTFLHDNHIDTSFLTIYKGTSRVALAFLDDQNNASYSFYHGDRLDNKKLVFPSAVDNSMVVFGSIFAIQKDIRYDLLQFIKSAHQAGNIIYYDPNIRPVHLDENPDAKGWILENLSFAHIVKGSCDDFNFIFNTNSSQDAYNALKVLNPNVILVVTSDKHGADLFTPSLHKHIDAPSITPVSTIGAGDTFSAGLIYGLFKAGITPVNLQQIADNQWQAALQYAIDFATEVCMSYENYISRRVGK